jgi:soluble lytic murein transglycosylase-like protein
MNTALALLFSTITQSMDLPPGLLESVCYVETKYDTDAIHEDDGGSDSFGICQIKLISAYHMGYRGSEEDLMRPEVNIYFAAKLLAYQVKRYRSDYAKAVTAYNRGHSINNGNSVYYQKVARIWSNYVNLN